MRLDTLHPLLSRALSGYRPRSWELPSYRTQSDPERQAAAHAKRARKNARRLATWQGAK